MTKKEKFGWFLVILLAAVFLGAPGTDAHTAAGWMLVPIVALTIVLVLVVLSPLWRKLVKQEGPPRKPTRPSVSRPTQGQCEVQLPDGTWVPVKQT